MGNIINTLLEMGPESISMFVNYFFIVLGAVIGYLIYSKNLRKIQNKDI